MKTIMSILIPPVGVAMKGAGTGQIIFNIVLTLIGFFPGMIHALIVRDESPGGLGAFDNSSVNNVADELEKLHNLKEKGIITEAEFQARKHKLI